MMSRRLLLVVPALLYTLSAVAADGARNDEPHSSPERWGDLAPEYGVCEEDARGAGVGAPWIASRQDRSRESPAESALLAPTDIVPERRTGN